MFQQNALYLQHEYIYMKKFNITGTCISERHYMADTGNKIRKMLEIVENGDYFVINRPRQYGKTTTLALLRRELSKSGDYLPVRLSFEGVLTEILSNIDKKVVLMIDELDKSSDNDIFIYFLGMLRNKFLAAREGYDVTFHI